MLNVVKIIACSPPSLSKSLTYIFPFCFHPPGLCLPVSGRGFGGSTLALLAPATVPFLDSRARPQPRPSQKMARSHGYHAALALPPSRESRKVAQRKNFQQFLKLGQGIRKMCCRGKSFRGEWIGVMWEGEMKARVFVVLEEAWPEQSRACTSVSFYWYLWYWTLIATNLELKLNQMKLFLKLILTTKSCKNAICTIENLNHFLIII